MSRLEWVVVEDVLRGESARLLKVEVDDAEASPRVAIVSGLSADDVLGPEVIRGLYKEGKSQGVGCELVAWPMTSVAADCGTGEVGCTGSGGTARSAGERIVASFEDADAVIHIATREDMEAVPYAIVPPHHAFSRATAFEASVRLASALGSVYVMGEEPHGYFEESAAAAGVPVITIVAGARRETTRALRDELRRRLAAIFDALAGNVLVPQGGSGTLTTIRAGSSGFLHKRVQAGEVLPEAKAIAATWAFEPDCVEEFVASAGTVLEISRKGMVDVDDVVARVFAAETRSG